MTLEDVGSLVTREEAANFFRVKPRTMDAWRFRKMGPEYIRVGGLIRYTQNSLLSYVQSHREAPEKR